MFSMKAAFAKFIRSFTAVLCAIVWTTAIPLQMAFADVNSIPSGWWGSYETASNSRYILIIPSGGTKLSFKGYINGYGDIACSSPYSIYFRPVTRFYRENITAFYSSYAAYNSTTKQYVVMYGEAVFYGSCNSNNSNIMVLTGDDGYGDPESVDVYKMI